MKEMVTAACARAHSCARIKAQRTLHSTYSRYIHKDTHSGAVCTFSNFSTTTTKNEKEDEVNALLLPLQVHSTFSSRFNVKSHTKQFFSLHCNFYVRFNTLAYINSHQLFLCNRKTIEETVQK